jgi:protein arginine kinase activator
MICSECKVNQATVHVTKIINGKKTEMHLCEECAKKYTGFSPGFSIQNIMSGFLTDYSKSDISSIQCRQCGMTYDEFKQNGKFGCSECYKAFGKKINPVIRNIHGHDRHIGKIPSRAGKALINQRAIQTMKSKLKEAIDSEAYEKAAELRDQIRKMESDLGEGEK